MPNTENIRTRNTLGNSEQFIPTENGNILRRELTSASLKAVAYNRLLNELMVEFNNGSVYKYSGVPEEVYTNIIAAESAGRSFHTLVRRGGYSFTQVMPSMTAEERRQRDAERSPLA